jgi:hypothetical protein
MTVKSLNIRVAFSEINKLTLQVNRHHPECGQVV